MALLILILVALAYIFVVVFLVKAGKRKIGGYTLKH